MAAKALSISPQIFVEKSMLGWKEVKYKAIYDHLNNCITVCNMEHFGPIGIHASENNDTLRIPVSALVMLLLALTPHTISAYTKEHVRDVTCNIVKCLNITEPLNIQFIAKSTDVMCFECNICTYHLFPFVSKKIGVNRIEAAIK
eukprot:12784313-Ditylum_brightwellii.AAC.1